MTDDSINTFELKTSKVKNSILKNTQTSDVFNDVPNYQSTHGLSNDSNIQRSFHLTYNKTNETPTTSSWSMKSILLMVAAIFLCLIFLSFLLFMVYKLFKKPARNPVYIEMDEMNSQTPIVKQKNASYSVKNNSVQLQ